MEKYLEMENINSLPGLYRYTLMGIDLNWLWKNRYEYQEEAEVYFYSRTIPLLTKLTFSRLDNLIRIRRILFKVYWILKSRCSARRMRYTIGSIIIIPGILNLIHDYIIC